MRELKARFAACDTKTPRGLRDAALLAVLYGGGLRRFEAVRLELIHLAVTTDEGDKKSATLRVQGKGNKERMVPLPPFAIPPIMAWLGARGIAPGPLLLPVSKAGKVGGRTRRNGSLHMTEQSVQVILNELHEKAGVTVKDFTSHDFRRSYLTRLLDQGVDLLTVQRLAGHSSPVTTQLYDRRADAVKKAAVEKLPSPL